MTNWKERYRAFCEWQRTPYQVAPLSNEHHCCTTCGTSYQGNFCPRCGQSASIGRYSLTRTMLNFLDVWGVGNRGMFRTLRDLLLRPGFMIRDYLSGMQSAYFPPFKLFFLLATFSALLLYGGINIKGEKPVEDTVSTAEYVEKSIERRGEEQVSTRRKKAMRLMAIHSDNIEKFYNDHSNVMNLLLLSLASGFFFLFFRHGPAYPDLHFSEFLVTMVYSYNMTTLYDIIARILCLDDYDVVGIGTMLLVCIPLKQLSGHSWCRSLFYTLLAFGLLAVVFLSLFTLYITLLVMIS